MRETGGTNPEFLLQTATQKWVNMQKEQGREAHGLIVDMKKAIMRCGRKRGEEVLLNLLSEEPEMLERARDRLKAQGLPVGNLKQVV